MCLLLIQHDKHRVPYRAKGVGDPCFYKHRVPYRAKDAPCFYKHTRRNTQAKPFTGLKSARFPKELDGETLPKYLHTPLH